MIKNDQDDNLELELIIDMLEMGMPIEQIAELNNIPIEKVKEIADGQTK